MFLTIGMRKKWKLHSRSLGKFSIYPICVHQMSYYAIKLRHYERQDVIAEGSKANQSEEESSDNPFVDAKELNAMPAFSTAKKVYLEDFENFTVK